MLVYHIQNRSKQQIKNDEKYNTNLLVNSTVERIEYASRIKGDIKQAPKGQRTWAF